jgi:hypothetical protein
VGLGWVLYGLDMGIYGLNWINFDALWLFKGDLASYGYLSLMGQWH